MAEQAEDAVSEIDRIADETAEKIDAVNWGGETVESFIRAALLEYGAIVWKECKMIDTEENEALRKDLKRAQEWIVDRGPAKYINYACAQCVPQADPETLIPDYVCPYHKACAAIKEGS